MIRPSVCWKVKFMVKADPKDTDSATENKRNGFSDQEPVNTCQSSAAAQANELSFS